jgi:sugar O-acyltransferase (sialic acid O-acetyltransferase NeuD family)
MKPKLVIWGASGHAAVVADIVRLVDEYDLAGFLDDAGADRRGQAFFGSRVLGGYHDLRKLRRLGVTHVIPGFGNPARRRLIVAKAAAAGFALASAVHPKAIVAGGVRVGAATVVKAGAIVDPLVTIANNVIIGTSVSLGHECKVHDGAWLSGGVHVAAHASIGELSWIGTGAVIRDGVRVGAGSLVGAGAVVVGDIPDGVVAYGVPARIVRQARAEDFG